MKIYLDTIGCRLNQSEIETYARQFRAAGHSVVARPEDADLVVINTCAVTAAAESDSRQKIRQVARTGLENIVVTGCWTTLDPAGAVRLPGVKRVVPNLAKDQLVPVVLDLPLEMFDLEPLARELLQGAHRRTRAFLKVQDGCDNRCTFCITTLARGAGRSRSIPEILMEVRAAQNGGAQEIVLSGVHLGSWGHDFSQPRPLRNLIQAILDETDIPRVRLSSLEPWDLDETFFALWANPRLCRHLHLPLQSGSATILRRMARKTTPEAFTALVEAARALIPDVAITTDILVGFPGEDEACFAASLAFVQKMNFAAGHVFTYSERPGTAAANMKPSVPHSVRKERNARMRAVLAEAATAYRARFIGRELDVLWERATRLGPDHWELSGLTDNYVRVTAVGSEPLWNQFNRVRLIAQTEELIRGEILSSNPDKGVVRFTGTKQDIQDEQDKT